MPEENVIQFRAADRLMAWLEEHADNGQSVHMAAREAVECYAIVLEQELRRLDLTEPEASLIVDALNGCMTEPHTVGLVWANVADAVSLDHLDRKWDVDGPALVQKVRSMTPCQAAALADAVARFWKDTSMPTGERLRQVGLVRG